MILRVILGIQQAKLRKRLQTVLASHDIITTIVRSRKGLLERISKEGADLFIGQKTFLAEPQLDSINMLQQLPDPPGIVIITEEESPEERADLLAAGCDAVLYTNIPAINFQNALSTIIEKRRGILLKLLPARPLLAQPSLNDFVSNSPAMQTFLHVVRRVMASNTSILLLGETGVGKERLARAIHAESPRSNGPFIAVNCGALPETLLESELFGHEQGAFTGATRSRRGWFELAHNGTIFLDEIGEMPNHLQVKLLRVLQEKKVQRVGSERAMAIDVRIMAASNRDLTFEMKNNNFRKDLYYRLCVVALTIPPLRERVADIPDLVQSYIVYLRNQIGRDVFSINAEALEALCSYDWPGNVRELINVLERAMLLCSGDIITRDELPDDMCRPPPPPANTHPFIQGMDTFPDEWVQKPLHEAKKEFIRRFEKAYFTRLLEETNGKIKTTAQRAGIQTRSLFDKMKQLGLKKEPFRKKADRTGPGEPD